MRLLPIVVAVGVGAGDGLINPVGTANPIPHGHSLYGGAMVAAGFVGEQVLHSRPDLNYALMVSGVTLLASRLPGAFANHASQTTPAASGYSSDGGGDGGQRPPLGLPPGSPPRLAAPVQQWTDFDAQGRARVPVRNGSGSIG